VSGVGGRFGRSRLAWRPAATRLSCRHGVRHRRRAGLPVGVCWKEKFPARQPRRRWPSRPPQTHGGRLVMEVRELASVGKPGTALVRVAACLARRISGRHCNETNIKMAERPQPPPTLTPPAALRSHHRPAPRACGTSAGTDLGGGNAAWRSCPPAPDPPDPWLAPHPQPWWPRW